MSIAERPTAAHPSAEPFTSSGPLASSPQPGGFVQRHPVLTYYVLTFAISWGGVLALVGLGGLPARLDQRMTIGLIMLAGPSLAGLLMAGLFSGKAGLSEILGGCSHGG